MSIKFEKWPMGRIIRVVKFGKWPMGRFVCPMKSKKCPDEGVRRACWIKKLASGMVNCAD
jgi:hypothetical protein